LIRLVVATLQDNATATAAGGIVLFLVVSWAAASSTGATALRTGAATRRGRAAALVLVVPTDLTDQAVEGLVDVDSGFGGGFNEPARKVGGQVTTLWTRVSASGTGSGRHRRRIQRAEPPQCLRRTLLADSAVHVQIALVSHDNHREVILVLHPQNLLLERGDLDETRPAGDGVDQQEALAGAHVLLPHGGVLFLAGGIQHIEERDFVVDHALLAIRVWGACQ